MNTLELSTDSNIFMSETLINVKKRDGTLVPFKVENINKVIKWSIEGLLGVSLSDIEINTKLNLVDGITTREIHKMLIESSINILMKMHQTINGLHRV